MTNYNKLAAEIKKRDNKITIGACVGEIVNLTPVTIRIYYTGIPIDFTKFFNIKGMINGGTGVTTDELYVKEYPVEVGDKFLCVTGNDNQSLWILGKYELINDLYIYLEEE
ncbi:MAG: hypothetical protein LUH47_08840 [Clostridiales bacterium]|nr:hypothetical protein [Clostridiales bacterium]MCD8158547.1 hypothetical protein [Clostridiales bacterium]